MPAHSPEEIHALIAAAVNAGDLHGFVQLHEKNATRGTIVSRRQPDGSWRIVLDNPMTPD